MLNEELLLDAMQGIRLENVKRAEAFLGYAEETTRPFHVHRKLWSTLLVAAIIVSLFTVTAYAMGWFGLKERSFVTHPVYPALSVDPSISDRPQEPEAVYFISMNGYADSPEYRANAEWAAFWWDYIRNTEIDYYSGYLDGADEDTVNTCHFYGVYDQTMKDKLWGIAEEYGLKLHTHSYTPLDITDFYRTAGTNAFLCGDAEGGGYIYEDGSFKIECDLTPEGATSEDEVHCLVLQRHMAGTMLPYQRRIEAPESYEEWEYSTVHGDTVHMSYRPENNELMVFFDLDGVFVELNVGRWMEPFQSREEMEQIADLVIFHELLKTEVNTAVVQHGPTVCNEPGDAATLDDFLATPEGQAANEYALLQGELRKSVEGNQHLLEIQPTMAEKHGLTYTQTHSLVYSQESIDSGMYDVMNVDLISQEAFAALGYDKQICEQFYEGFDCYDNGLICGAAGMEWRYIPDGAFCPFLTAPIATDYSQQWFFRTRCGAVVLIAADLPETERTHVIIYRTEKGWLIGQGGWANSAYELEYYADTLDFTVFP